MFMRNKKAYDKTVTCQNLQEGKTNKTNKILRTGGAPYLTWKQESGPNLPVYPHLDYILPIGPYVRISEGQSGGEVTSRPRTRSDRAKPKRLIPIQTETVSEQIDEAASLTVNTVQEQFEEHD